LLACPNDYVDLNSREADLWLWGDPSKHEKPHTDWLATQYHRPDLDEGMVLAFRRPDSPYSSVQVSLRGIDPAASYEISWDSQGPGATKILPGAKLSSGFEIVLPKKHSSELIVYRKVR
jgi:alpha-galactosidase